MNKPMDMKKLLCSSADLQISKRYRSISRALAVSFFVLLLCRHGVEWDCDIIADVDNGLDECIVPNRGEIYAWNVRLDSRLILSYFLNYSIFYVIKRVKKYCPCTVEIKVTWGCALVTSLHSPTARAGFPTMAQPCVLLISTRATILNPFSSDGKWH